MFGRVRSHKLYIPLITILGSAALFFAYSFIYVSWQENYANERAFRLLSVVGDQLTKHFENLQSVMAAALVSSAADGSGNGQQGKAARYINQVAGYGGQISVLEEHSPCPADWKRDGEMKLYLLDIPSNFSLRAEFKATQEGQPAPCSLQAEVKPALEFRERFHNLTADYFDDILIAASTGEVLFESNASGLRISNLDTLVAMQSISGGARPEGDGKDKAKPSPFRDISQFSNVREVRFAGSSYKLYVQPVPLQIISGGKEKQYLKTVMCGLWRTDRQQSELVSIPYATLIWGILGVLAVFGLLWPLLKVAYMSPTERLKRTHVFYLISSALFVTAVLTTLVLNGAYMSRLDDDARRQLDSLGERIDGNVRVELARALTLMNRLECSRSAARELLSKATREKWTMTRILDNPAFGEFTTIYPYFDNVYWADQKGVQLLKLTVRGEATPQTPVGDSTYFRYVRERQHLMTLGAMPANSQRLRAEGPEFDDDVLRMKFRLETRYSPNTGEYFVVLAKPAGSGLPPYLAGAAAEVLVTKFLSLQQPALPAGFGYAVVDHEGLVQFHSNEGRNQIEDFFKESRENPVIKAMIANGTKGFVNVDYSGRQQLMRVWPLPYLAEPALTLIVFRDTNYFRTINMACMLTFGLLAAMFSVPFIALLATYIARCGSYPLAKLWPNPADRDSYIRILMASACITAAFAIQYPEMEIDDSLRAIVAIFAGSAFLAVAACRRCGWSEIVKTSVVTAIILAIAGLSWALLAAGVYIALSLPVVSRRLLPNTPRATSPRVLYVATVFALLTAMVVVPCFGIFKIAYHSISRLALETALQDRYDLLLHRADAIRDHFSDVDTASGQNAGPISPNLDRVLKLRINERLDRYDRPVFAPRGLETPDPKQGHMSVVEKRIARLAAWFPNNSFGGQLRQASLSELDGSESPWLHGESKGYEVIVMKNDSRDSFPDQALRGVYPMWQLPRRAVALMGLLAILLIVWLNYMVRKLFLTDLPQVPPLDEWVLVGAPESSLLIIGNPKSGRSTQAAQIPDKDWIDLAQVVASGDWTVPELNHSTVVVDNFEFDIENADACQAKLKLLEGLVFVRNKRVVLLSTVDPMFYAVASSPESEASSQILDRWAALLSGFVKFELMDLTKKTLESYVAGRAQGGADLPADLVALVREECDYNPHLRKIGVSVLGHHVAGDVVSQDELVEELMDRTDAYYRVLWAACTNQERLVLFQLARDGWANPKNARAIQQLERRGLVRRSPGLRIMNESFCRFVNSAQLPGEVAKWEENMQNSTWSALKLGFTTAALAAGVWLLYTQQELFQAGLGYVAAMGTASGAVISLIRNVSHAKASGAPEKASNA